MDVEVSTLPMSRGRFILAAVGVWLLGCEAPLELSGVERELQQPVHRYDQLQAAARQGEQVVVVGADGAVLVSGANSDEWQRHDIPGHPQLIDVAACPDGSYVALDTSRRLWLSENPANAWQSVAIDTTEALMDLTCDSLGRIWVVGGFSTILSSEDGGASWGEDSFGDDVQLTSVQFLDDSVGYIAGEFGMVLKTIDGGQTWEPVEVLPGDFYPQAAHFMDTERGWVVGLNGAILHTPDGGDSWESQDSGVNVPLYGVTGVGETLYAVGENGVVLRYSDGDWQALPHGKSILSYLRSVSAGADTLVVAGGNGALLTLSMGG